MIRKDKDNEDKDNECERFQTELKKFIGCVSKAIKDISHGAWDMKYECHKCGRGWDDELFFTNDVNTALADLGVLLSNAVELLKAEDKEEAE